MGKNEFIKSVESSIKQLTTKSVKDTFFNNWFKGKIYSFIFKENYGVTNIQYRELLSLIRSNCSVKDNLIFMTSEDFRNKINNIIMSEWKEAHLNELNPPDKEKNAFAQDIADKYSESFERIIVIDSYYQSCLVFLPPCIQINLERICFLSGYILSCGESIYFRNIDKASANEFIRNLGEYGITNITDNQKVDGFIVPLTNDKNLKSNERFKLNKTDSLTSDLNNMKLYLEKAHLDDKLLSEFLDIINYSYIINKKINGELFKILDNLKSKNKNYYLIDTLCNRSPNGAKSEFSFISGDCINLLSENQRNNLKSLLKSEPVYTYHVDIDGFKNQFYDDILGSKRDVFWLLVDHNISREASSPGEESYYGCVKIAYINNSPFAIFDEDKPGWVDQVTLPHSLTAAMLNVAMENVNFCNDFKGKVKICDPFVGTGTTYLESLKYCEYISFIGGDCDESSLDALYDNVRIFLDDHSASRATLAEFLAGNIDDLLSNAASRKVRDFKIYISACWNYLKQNIDNIPIDNTLLSGYRGYDSIYKILEKPSNYPIPLETIIKFLDEKIGFYGKTLPDDLIDLSKRLYAYCVIKAYKRNRNLALDSESQFIAVLDEIINIQSRLSDLDRPYTQDSSLLLKNKTSADQYSEGSYSFCTFNLNICQSDFFNYFSYKDHILKCNEFTTEIYCLKANQLLEQRIGDGVDIIITDPPYGFNTGTSNEEKKALRELYSTIFERMVLSVKDNGCIILCLPSKSHSGKHLHYYSLRDSVISRLYDAVSSSAGMSIQQDFSPCIVPSDLYKAPFYWNSKKALKRDILFFRFNRRKATNGDNEQ